MFNNIVCSIIHLDSVVEKNEAPSVSESNETDLVDVQGTLMEVGKYFHILI